MKKKTIIILGACMALAAAGCGNDAAQKENGTEAVLEEGTENGGAASVDIEYDVDDYVKLGDYKGIEVTLNEADYEVTEDQVNTYVDQAISYTKPYVPDESKTEVGKNDIVDVNYVGKKDGVAFDGGSAENQIIDVANNCEVTMGSGYIEGFTDGLVGAKVGETVDSEVTFPEDYDSEELKGQKVTFTFTVNAVCKEVKREALDAAYVKDNFQVESVEEFYTNSRKYLEESAEMNKKTDLRAAVLEALADLCTVESFPEGIVEARMEESLDSIRKNYCTDGMDLKTFLQNN